MTHPSPEVSELRHVPAVRYFNAVQEAGQARAVLESYGAIAEAMLRIKALPTEAELIGLRSAIELLEFRVGSALVRRVAA